MRKKLDTRLFERLGNTVLAGWKAREFRYSAFSKIAVDTLREFQIDIGSRGILHWALSNDDIPEQDVTSEFGQPPVTLYNHELFHIEALFWLDGTTSIHQHAFSGAFQVLEGSSIHSQYTFKKVEELTARYVLGEIRLKKTEYLKKGDIRPILGGKQFIHSLFHLDFPSVSLVIRTEKEPEYAPQYDYRPPFIAVDPFSVPRLITRRSQILDTLEQIASVKNYFREIRQLIANADFEMTYLLLTHSHHVLKKDQFERLLLIAKKKYGTLIDLLVPVLEQQSRQFRLILLRKSIKDSHHRFFLALLLNLGDRKSIFDFIRKRYAGNPLTHVQKWIKELSEPKESLHGKNLFEISWDQTSEEMMQYMLQGLSYSAILRNFEKEYSRKEVQRQKHKLHELYSAFRSSFFHPLFETSYRLPNVSRNAILL